MREFALVSLILVFLGGVSPAQSTEDRTDVLNVHQLPLGDGKISRVPERGFVMVCNTNFFGRGAQRNGPWIHGDTWDLTQKLTVQGSIMWPQAQLQIATQDGERVVSRVIQGNGLPVNTPTGIFPVATDDPAFQIDRNPNSIQQQRILLSLPVNPELAASTSCVPMGMIGVALNGVAIYNALDAAGRDGVAHEVQDVCSGHPQREGQYHYHGPSPCLPDELAKEKLVGYALDGFGIYSMYDPRGRELTDVDLDECHGRTSEVEWNGTRHSIYHYVLTREYPYTIGCFRGTPVRSRLGFGPPRFVQGGPVFGLLRRVFSGGLPPPPGREPDFPPRLAPQNDQSGGGAVE